MIYLSAGHNFKALNPDPGAIGNGYKESELTRELRDMVAAELKSRGFPYILDKDSETLGEYISRIKPGSGSVLCEIHFNAAGPDATGAEVLVKEGASKHSNELAKEMSAAISDTVGIKNRGAKDESSSHRGRLGILHTLSGIAVLPEICFISNANDVQLYQSKKNQLATSIALLLIKYENLNS